MKIAIASGKGGTGKTFVSTNLAYILSAQYSVNLFDLDVEEPNDHLFFSQTIKDTHVVQRMIPLVNADICDHKGVCTQVCEYHAIISLANTTMVFPELCHSCYGCLELCPTHAITEGFKEIGKIHRSQTDGIGLITGELKVGESSATSLIAETKTSAKEGAKINIYDAPPGTSCPVIEAVKDMDYIALVTEPTPFGLHDLDLMAQTLDQIDRPYGVILNKAQPGNNLIGSYCNEHNIEIIASFPQDINIARAYAEGKIVSAVLPEIGSQFKALFKLIQERIS